MGNSWGSTLELLYVPPRHKPWLRNFKGRGEKAVKAGTRTQFPINIGAAKLEEEARFEIAADVY